MPPLFVIDHHNGVPAYRQVMDQVKFQIATGVLEAGAEVASTRALSAALGLNPMTVSKAYSLLERDGILERRRGQNLVVRARSSADTQTARTEPLRHHLVAAATMARQLGLSTKDAVQIFRETLDQNKP